MARWMAVVEDSRDSKVRVFWDLATRASSSESDSLESSSHTFFCLPDAAEESELESSELDPDSEDEDATPAQKRDMV